MLPAPPSRARPRGSSSEVSRNPVWIKAPLARVAATSLWRGKSFLVPGGGSSSGVQVRVAAGKGRVRPEGRPGCSAASLLCHCFFVCGSWSDFKSRAK